MSWRQLRTRRLDRARGPAHASRMWVFGILALVGAVVMPLAALAGVRRDQRPSNAYWLGYVVGLAELLLLYAAWRWGMFG